MKSVFSPTLVEPSLPTRRESNCIGGVAPLPDPSPGRTRNGDLGERSQGAGDCGPNNVAEIYRRQRKDAEALPLLERAVSIAERALGSDHPSSNEFRKNLKACQDAMH